LVELHEQLGAGGLYIENGGHPDRALGLQHGQLLFVDLVDAAETVDQLLTALDREISLLNLQDQVAGAHIKEQLLLPQRFAGGVDVGLAGGVDRIPADRGPRLKGRLVGAVGVIRRCCG